MTAMPKALVSYDLGSRADHMAAAEALRKAGYSDAISIGLNTRKALPTTTFSKVVVPSASANIVLAEVLQALKGAQTPAAKVAVLVNDDLVVWP